MLLPVMFEAGKIASRGKRLFPNGLERTDNRIMMRSKLPIRLGFREILT